MQIDDPRFYSEISFQNPCGPARLSRLGAARYQGDIFLFIFVFGGQLYFKSVDKFILLASESKYIVYRFCESRCALVV